MLKMLMLISFLPLSLFSAELQLPHMIDYGKYPTSSDNGPIFAKEPWSFGLYAFNHAPELIPFISALKRTHNIDVAVETGTFRGETTTAFALLFDEVHTIEIVENTFISSQKNLEYFSNVHCHLGSSDVVLKQILPSLQNQRILFYLDAHWEEFWPLLQELEEISQTHRDNCIVVIDDFKVPGRSDIGYDYWGNHECSYEYIQTQLDKVFTSYTYHYLIPRSVHSRAKFVVIPKEWVSTK